MGLLSWDGDWYPTAEEVCAQVEEKQSLKKIKFVQYLKNMAFHKKDRDLKSKSMLVFGLNEIVAKMS